MGRPWPLVFPLAEHDPCPGLFQCILTLLFYAMHILCFCILLCILYWYKKEHEFKNIYKLYICNMCFQFHFFVFLISRPWFMLNLLAGLTCNPIGSNAFFHSQFAFNGNPRFLFIFEPFQYVWMWSLVGLTSMGPPPCEVNHVSPSLQSWRRDKQLSWYQGYIFSMNECKQCNSARDNWTCYQGSIFKQNWNARKEWKTAECTGASIMSHPLPWQVIVVYYLKVAFSSKT